MGKRRAFTLIEILVAVGIIAALVAMVFLGFGHVRHGVDETSTRVMIDNLKGMMVEYRATGASEDAIESLFRIDPPTSPAPPDFPAARPDFPNNYQVRAPDRAVSVDALPQDRDCPAVVKTRRVMTRLLAVPANKAIVDALPAEQQWWTSAGVVLLDAHRNPILYVPHKGITRVNFGRRVLDDGKEGFADADRAVYTLAQHGFWVSAGADARFDTGDDNVWSITPQK
jgi:prepilin-type N-terminal cleavage/methylation domain-containing protein